MELHYSDLTSYVLKDQIENQNQNFSCHLRTSNPLILVVLLENVFIILYNTLSTHPLPPLYTA
jgi:hypothetical protein